MHAQKFVRYADCRFVLNQISVSLYNHNLVPDGTSGPGNVCQQKPFAQDSFSEKKHRVIMTPAPYPIRTSLRDLVNFLTKISTIRSSPWDFNAGYRQNGTSGSGTRTSDAATSINREIHSRCSSPQNHEPITQADQ